MAEDEESNRRRAEEKVVKALKASGKRSKLKKGVLTSVPDAAKYNIDDPRQKLLDKTVAVYVGATNAPYAVVGNEHFQLMLQSFEPCYRIPGRFRLLSLISDVVAVMKRSIQSAMTNARQINFCADIWSKRGLTSSYLGLTAHFYSPDKRCIQHATLAVRHLPYPHTGLWHTQIFTYMYE